MRIIKKGCNSSVKRIIQNLNRKLFDGCQKIKYFLCQSDYLSFSKDFLETFILYMCFFPLKVMKNFQSFNIKNKISVKNFDRNFFENLKKAEKNIKEYLK